MKMFALLVALTGLLALPAWSQIDDELPRFEVMGGFSHVTGDLGLNGWEAGASYRANRWLGLVADFSGHYGSDNIFGIGFDSNLHNFLFGPRVYIPLENHPQWKPFGQLLLGGSRVNNSINNPLVGTDNTDSSFAWTLGGGVDYQFREQLRVRLVQLELLRTNFFDTGDNRMRVGIGLVYQFGRR